MASILLFGILISDFITILETFQREISGNTSTIHKVNSSTCVDIFQIFKHCQRLCFPKKSKGANNERAKLPHQQGHLTFKYVSSWNGKWLSSMDEEFGKWMLKWLNPTLPMVSYTLNCPLWSGQNNALGAWKWDCCFSVGGMCHCKWTQSRVYPALLLQRVSQRSSHEKHLRVTLMYYYNRKGSNTCTALTLQTSQSQTSDTMPNIQMTTEEKQKQACRCFP